MQRVLDTGTEAGLPKRRTARLLEGTNSSCANHRRQLQSGATRANKAALERISAVVRVPHAKAPHVCSRCIEVALIPLYELLDREFDDMLSAILPERL